MNAGNTPVKYPRGDKWIIWNVETMSKCTEYTTDWNCDEDPPLCRCPNCQGFLPRDFPFDKQFLCRKCGAVLEAIEGEYKGEGQICPVPKYAVKISTELPPRQRRERKKKTELWAMGRGFSRRVWEDKKGRFIEIESDRLELSDRRILKVVGK